ncbi:MAG TPA: alpha/beta fold hydrolase [Desulfosarcina sp.]|nr:alpha/beta fold hydrolase [Desulfosarcina sp.]
MAEKIHFRCVDLLLEGLYESGTPERGVVVTHPHPLYGGDMRNPVVEAIHKAYRRAGFTTLRFNFRGTGKSTGTFANGIGERADVAAAVDCLRSRGVRHIHLAGYSFGAWVNANALQGDVSADGLIMVAPPLAFIAFDGALRLPMLSTVVVGSRDDFAPPDLVRAGMLRWNARARLEIIDGADHFFFGHLDEVSRRLVRTLMHAP